MAPVSRKYTTTLGCFILALAIFLLGLDAFIVAQQQRNLLDNFTKQTNNEFTLIASFVRDPLLQEEFTLVEQFIQQWGKVKPEIVSLQAFSPQGLLLTEYSRPPSPDQKTASFNHSIYYQNIHLLDLKIIKDLSLVTRHIHHFWHQLLLQSGIITLTLGIILWFILKKMAITPLEDEIFRRQQVEQELQNLNATLEKKVLARTTDLEVEMSIISEAIKKIHQEIAKKEETERELFQEKERLAVTLRSIADGVITTDIAGQIIFLNRAAERLTGWRQHEAKNLPLTRVCDIINQENGEQLVHLVEKILENGNFINLPSPSMLIDKKGSQRDIAAIGTPLRGSDSEIIGIVLTFRDITQERKKANERAKIRKLESVGLLAGGIAHDFNNILTAILGNINLALLYSGPDHKIHSLLTAAEKASLRAKGLTQQLLTFAKGGAPIKKLSHIKDVIQDSANFVLRGTKTRCTFQCEELWPVEIDQEQISQVIQNLIINANQAMPDGGKIEISCQNIHDNHSRPPHNHPGQDSIKITITDSGQGIAPSLLSQIFDPYFTTKTDGSGLGLAISHSIIEKHGGTMQVTSKQGQGTTFTIFLPAEKNRIVPAQTKITPLSITEMRGHGRVMVMDDEVMLSIIAQEMLSLLGYEVLLATDGKEAIALYKESLQDKKPIDIVIMDLTIPGGMGGQEAVGEIHKLDPQAKVIVASGYSNDPIMANYQKYGFQAALVKPFQIQDLHETILAIAPN